VGGTWIEPDCNLPSGESLVRQLLHGQRFFERELGRRCTELWNPDVFGYTNQLPQLMRGAGMRRFLTQKLSWNRFTTPGSHSFRWEGLDGSRVLTHFPPSDTYNATVSVHELRRGAAAYKDHDRSGHSMLVFGLGDGGGGPTARMLETLRRVGDLQGIPRTRLSTSEAFFAELEGGEADLPVVVGELYLEYHRGTYTSQAAVKRGNRRAEAALHDAEFLAAAAARARGEAYPAAELGALWRLLLLNQFHDILPGSSIGEVYEESRGQLAAVVAGADRIAQAAAAVVAGADGAAPGAVVPVNTIGVPRAEVTAAPGGRLVFATAPPYGPGAVADPPAAATAREEAGGFVLDNGRLRARLGRDGTLTSLLVLGGGAEREALSGPANVLELYEDRPVDYDAWDIDPSHLETGRPGPGAHAAELRSAGPLRAAVRFTHALGAGSTLTQEVRLDAGAAALVLHTRVDWHERHTLLKVAFGVAVRATRATYEVAFGHAERPTHFSAPADAARFEVPAHRWADLSEHGFGVAVLNDSTYGHSAHGEVLRLSLLRAPAWPDPDADQGSHALTYALMPHRGGWREAGVVGEAARLSHPLRWAPGAAPARSLAAVDDPNVVLDTIKRAEDSGALVLRLVEVHGARGTAAVTLDPPPGSARRANLLEDAGPALELRDGAILVPYLPHEVITVLVD
jgi:alpha-mannosidase